MPNIQMVRLKCCEPLVLQIFIGSEGTGEALPAILSMLHEATGGTCWQCGAPADPTCVCTQSLVNHAKYADGQGYPITTSAWGNHFVKVPIPRCEACRRRNYLSGFLTASGVSIGACVGMIQFPSRGLTTIIGAVVGCVPGVLLALYYRRIRGLRSIEDYPPLKRLRESGWDEPA
jgi:hypothetical protein